MSTEPTVAPLEVVTLRACAVDRFAALGPALLARAEVELESKPLLVIAELVGDALLLGRHQRQASCLNAERLRESALPVFRRASGGRTLRAGAGTVGVLLVLPTLDALGSGPVIPDKLINRHVRGLLVGLTRLGVPHGAHYFGRDFVSAESQQVGAVGQDTLSRAGLFEAIVAIDAQLSLPPGLAGYPEHSDLRAKGPAPTTLKALRGSVPSFEEIAAAVSDGYQAKIPASFPTPVERAPAGHGAEVGWSESGVADIPIGFLEALVQRVGSGVSAVRLHGDFLAPAFLVAELEQSLANAPMEFAELGKRVDAAFHRPGAFVIGMRELRLFADAVLAAAAEPATPLGAS